MKPGDVVVRVIVPTWIFAGATLKLLTGSPLDLPDFILNLPLTLHNAGIVPAGANAGWQVFMLVIALEYVLATLIALHRGLARPLATLTLIAFCAVVLVQMRAGTGTCGCLGTVTLPLWLMLGIDAALLLGVLLLPGRAGAGRPPVSSARWLAITLTAGTLIGATWLAFSRDWVGRLGDPARLVEINLLRSTGRDWREVMLFSQTPKTPADFPESVQTWVIYRDTCEVCHTLFRSQFSTPSGRRVVAVLVPADPPLTPEQRAALAPIQCAECDLISLPEGRNYRIATPIVIRIENGKLVEVARIRS